MSRKKTPEEIVERFITTHGNKYDYSKMEYTGVDAKIIIICPLHGEFLQSPDKHRTGNGCPKCGDISVRAKLQLSNEEVLAKFADKHGDRYDYSKVHYINTDTKVVIGCKEHGDFSQTPYKHQFGNGCPSCATYGFNPLKPAILYYLRVTKDDITVYKVGVTNKTVHERYKNYDLDMITILKIWEYDIGADAYNAEQSILELNRQHMYVGPPILANGNTELFIKDVGELDE